MTDLINDYRGIDNHYQVCKHKKSNRKKKYYRTQRSNIVCKRLPTRYYRIKVLINYDSYDNYEINKLEDQLNSFLYGDDDDEKKDTVEKVYSTFKYFEAPTNRPDLINDYRGSDNRYQVCKHNKSNIKREYYRMQRTNIIDNRLPARYYRKTILIDDDNEINELEDELNSFFCNTEEDTVWELCNSNDIDDIDRLYTLLLYSTLESFQKPITISGHSEKSFYPIEVLFIIAAHYNCDELIRMYLTEPFSVDVNTQLKQTNLNGILRDCTQCKHYSFTFDETALWFACFHGHLNTVRTLIEFRKADVNFPKHSYQAPLPTAISQGHFDIVRYLIEQTNAIIHNYRDFFVAIKCQNYDIIKYLLDKGCNPNVRFINDQDKK